jgi:hypothetical protein
VNRWWEVVDANAAIALAGLHEELAAGTPMDITVSELAIESFYPADETTAAALT